LQRGIGYFAHPVEERFWKLLQKRLHHGRAHPNAARASLSRPCKLKAPPFFPRACPF
jgi:hypothetical protein